MPNFVPTDPHIVAHFAATASQYAANHGAEQSEAVEFGTRYVQDPAFWNQDVKDAYRQFDRATV